MATHTDKKIEREREEGYGDFNEAGRDDIAKDLL